MNKYINTKDNNITVFSTYCIENFPFIEEDFDSITNYQMLCKVVEYLNKVINQVNLNTEETEKYTKLFIELKNYIDNYFNNLDVQEEINIKLDQMVTDGIFDDILMYYANITKVYNTFTDLLNDENIVNNMNVKTLGYYNINDGGSATYKITDIKNETEYQEDLNKGLYATLIVNNEVNIKQLGSIGDGITDDFEIFQKALNYISNKKINLILEYNTRYFISKELTIFKNSDINLNNSTLISAKTHLFFNFKSTKYGWSANDEYLLYDGNGNISIYNGIIEGGGISFIHGANINLINIKFNKCKNDHIIEISACKNFTVDNCVFSGVKPVVESRTYVENIQIDNCDYISFPWLNEENPTYDNTINTHINIKNNLFKNSDDSQYILYTAIGNHSESTNLHNNIDINNNIIIKPFKNGISLMKIDTCYINNNKIIESKEHCINFKRQNNNINIINNDVSSVWRGSFIAFNEATPRNSNIVISRNKIRGTGGKGINIGTCDNVECSYNITNTQYLPAINNCNNIVISNNTITYPTVDKLYTDNNNNTFNFTDQYLSVLQSQSTSKDTITINLKYDITQFNEITFFFGFVSSKSYNEKSIKSFIGRNFILNDEYRLNIINRDGVISSYIFKVDADNPKIIYLTHLTGTIGEEIRSIYTRKI